MRVYLGGKGYIEIPDSFEGGAAYTFVLRPGGIAGDNVYTDWTSLYAALSAVQGPKLVDVDGSLAPAHMTAAATTYQLDGVELFSSQQTVQGYTLIVDDGATIDFNTLFVNGIIVESQSTKAVFTASGAPFMFLYNEAAVFCDVGAAPFFEVPDGVQFFPNFIGASALGTGLQAVHQPVLDVALGGDCYVQLFAGSFAFDNAFSGAGTITVNMDSSSVLGAHGPNVTPALASIASNEGYTATTPGNWGGPGGPPTEVNAAIDRLAAAFAAHFGPVP